MEIMTIQDEVVHNLDCVLYGMPVDHARSCDCYTRALVLKQREIEEFAGEWLSGRPILQNIRLSVRRDHEHNGILMQVEYYASDGSDKVYRLKKLLPLVELCRVHSKDRENYMYHFMRDLFIEFMMHTPKGD